MRHMTAALALLLLGSLTAQADIILSGDFTGRTVSGATASDITWSTNGVENPGDLTADSVSNLFDGAQAQDKFIPQRNLGNEGPWSVDILLELLEWDIALTTVSLDAFIFSNLGVQQTVGRRLDMSLDLIDDSTTLASTSALGIYTNTSSPIGQPRPVTFDLSGNTLMASTAYTLRLTAFNGETDGNNAGFNNLVVNGDFLTTSEIPEPAPLSILLLGAAAMLAGLRQRRRHA